MTGPKQQSLCMHSCLGILCMLVATYLILCVCVCVQAVSGSLTLISAKFPLHRMHIPNSVSPNISQPFHLETTTTGTCCSHACTMQSHAPMTTSILAFTLHSCAGYVLYVHSSSSFNQPHGACMGAGPGR